LPQYPGDALLVVADMLVLLNSKSKINKLITKTFI
jgi:hypothetical protein